MPVRSRAGFRRRGPQTSDLLRPALALDGGLVETVDRLDSAGYDMAHEPMDWENVSVRGFGGIDFMRQK